MILGIYGFQDAGKTLLVENLVKKLVDKGYRVSSVKHTPHKKSMDSEGKDTWRHWRAGSDPVVFSSEIETSIIRHSKMQTLEIARLVQEFFAPDILIIEGFKDGDFPKVAVGKVKPRKGTVLVNPTLPRLVRWVENEIAVERVLAKLPGLDCGKCGLDCRDLAKAVAAGKKRVDACRELADRRVEVLIGNKKLPMGRFASAVVEETVRGLLNSLRGNDPSKDVEIRLECKRRASKKR